MGRSLGVEYQIVMVRERSWRLLMSGAPSEYLREHTERIRSTHRDWKEGVGGGVEGWGKG
jgi:hypothetical protein